MSDRDWTEASLSAGGATGFLLTNSKVALAIAKAMPPAVQSWLVQTAGRAALGSTATDAAATAGEVTIVALGEDGAASLVADSVLGPVGAAIGVVTASGEIIYGLYKMNQAADAREEAQTQFENVYAQFLVDGLHTKPWLALELSRGEDGTNGPTEALEAYAKYYGIKPDKLIQYLSGTNPEFAGQFIRECMIAQETDIGPIPGSVWAGPHQLVVDSYGANSPLAGRG